LLENEEAAREPWLSHWHAVRADIDPLGIAILGRVIRLGPTFEAFRAGTLAEFGLTPEVSDLIISLLRNGPPNELNLGALGPESTFPVASSGAMTYRVDNAERLGLVERKPDAKDRRGVMVALTPKGLELAHRVVDVHMVLVEKFLAGFSPDDRASLGRLLQRLIEGLAPT
jgi:DNA-binding MarR family transcriptional regulator